MITQKIFKNIILTQLTLIFTLFAIVIANEVYEQPNWIEYSVSNRPKNVDRLFFLKYIVLETQLQIKTLRIRQV